MTTAELYETIAYDVTDGIATITFDRPDKLNAFVMRMGEEFLDVMDRVDGDDAVRAAIFTGRGRAFCAGADLDVTVMPTRRAMSRTDVP